MKRREKRERGKGQRGGDNRAIGVKVKSSKKGLRYMRTMGQRRN